MNQGKPAAAYLLVRVKLQGGGVFGPGKAELLEQIGQLGSISAAARAMRMSYRQAWKLIETMNGAFREPVIATSQGGVRGGGATLSPLGKQLIRSYRSLQQKAARSTATDLEVIADLVAANAERAANRRSVPREDCGNDDLHSPDQDEEFSQL